MKDWFPDHLDTVSFNQLCGFTPANVEGIRVLAPHEKLRRAPHAGGVEEQEIGRFRVSAHDKGAGLRVHHDDGIPAVSGSGGDGLAASRAGIEVRHLTSHLVQARQSAALAHQPGHFAPSAKQAR